MKAWVEYMRREAGATNLWTTGFHFGDWLAFATTASDYPGATTGKDLIASAFYAHSTDLLQQAAAVLGKKDDAAEYAALLPKIKEAFLKEFVTASGRVGENTQTAYAVALQFDLLPEDLRAEAARRLAAEVKTRGHLTTGFVGTPYLCHVLSRYGYTDVAYLLLNREDYPSWLYPVKQGATTIWERWDGQKPDGTFQDVGMNSFNHYAYGAIGEWMYRVVAGLEIDPREPGYKHVLVQPQPGGGLTSAEARLQTLYGETVSGWALADGKVTVSATRAAQRARHDPPARGDARGGDRRRGRGGDGAGRDARRRRTATTSWSRWARGATSSATTAPGSRPGSSRTARFSTRTTVEVLLASPAARAVLDKRIPGFSSDPRVQQALQMSLREIAPYAPTVFTEEMLKTLDDDLRAIPERSEVDAQPGADREPARVEGGLGRVRRRLQLHARRAVEDLDAGAEPPRAAEAVVQPAAHVEAGRVVRDGGGRGRGDGQLVVGVGVVVGRLLQQVGLDLEERRPGEERPVEVPGRARVGDVEVESALGEAVAGDLGRGAAGTVQVERVGARDLDLAGHVPADVGVADQQAEPAEEAHLEGDVRAEAAARPRSSCGSSSARRTP